MRHGDYNRKFGREKGQRKALLKSLAISLIKHGKIQTTEAKAKEIRPMVEKLVTRAKTDTIASRRIISSVLASDSSVKKLFTEVGPKYKSRAGGYLRITKLPHRMGDAATMAQIEFI